MEAVLNGQLLIQARMLTVRPVRSQSPWADNGQQLLPAWGWRAFRIYVLARIDLIAYICVSYANLM